MLSESDLYAAICDGNQTSRALVGRVLPDYTHPWDIYGGAHRLHKTCPKCWNDRKFGFFSLSKRTEDGLHKVCRICQFGAGSMAAGPVVHPEAVMLDLAARWWDKKQAQRAATLEETARRTRQRVESAPGYAERVRLRKIKQRIRQTVSSALSSRGIKKIQSTEAMLGCTIDEFKIHIERQFLPGMSWENRHLWHLDHIVPMASATTEEEAAALNHCSNLRPIWAEDNLLKSDQRLFLI